MNEQLTIFQVFDIGTDADPDLETLPEAEMVREIERATGLNFKLKPYGYKQTHNEYSCKVGRGDCTICYSRFIEDHKRFIDVDFRVKTSGWSGPCETLSQAIRYIKRGIEREKELKKEEIEIDLEED